MKTILSKQTGYFLIIAAFISKFLWYDIFYRQILDPNGLENSDKSPPISTAQPAIYESRKSEPLQKFNCSQKCKNPPKFVPFDERPRLYDYKPNLVKALVASKNLCKLTMLHRELKRKSIAELYIETDEYIDYFWRIFATENHQFGLFAKKSYPTKVPEIYHYIWLSCNRKFEFYHFASIYSVLKHKTNSIIEIWFHTDCIPSKDLYFKKIRSIISEHPEIKLRIVTMSSEYVQRYLRKIWYNPQHYVKETRFYHMSDIYRILILLKFGGVYIDNDIVLTKFLGGFLDSDKPVIGEESDISLSNGLMLAPRDEIRFNGKLDEKISNQTTIAKGISKNDLKEPPLNAILKKWLFEYKNYMPTKIGVEPYSVMKIWMLWKSYPEEITVVRNQINRPYYHNLVNFMFEGHFDWTETYSVHMSEKMLNSKYQNYTRGFEDIECLNNSFAEILRDLFFDDKLICGAN